MISDLLKFINDNINFFDVIFSIIMIYFIIQCYLKGFTLSLISFMKWVVSLVITIVLVPIFRPKVSEYIESEFINEVGIGIAVFICALFLSILAGRMLSRVVKWTGVGPVDKTFGLLFGFFKGYIVSVCIFSLFNWFYPYPNWGISTKEAISFDVVIKGSEILIEEFPSNRDFLDTKDKIEKI